MASVLFELIRYEHTYIQMFPLYNISIDRQDTQDTMLSAPSYVEYHHIYSLVSVNYLLLEQGRMTNYDSRHVCHNFSRNYY